MKPARSIKYTVRVDELMSNPNNPRQDFGDISELAERIRLTGGQPVQPLIVVRSGSRFMIVDGDRRYRAMLELGTEECEALVFNDWSEASQAVAMLATDDKKQLTDEERGRGMQLMLALDVSDEDAAAALNVDARAVGRVRRLRDDFEGKQCSLDAMIATVSDERFTYEDRARILAGAEKGVDAASMARDISRRYDQDSAFGRIAEALAGQVEVVDGRYSYSDEECEGFRYLTTVRSVSDAEEFVTDILGDRTAYRGWRNGATVEVYTNAPRASEEPTAEELEARRARAEHGDEYGAMAHSMRLYIAQRPPAAVKPWPKAALEVFAARRMGTWHGGSDQIKRIIDGLDEDLETPSNLKGTDISGIALAQPSMWEAWWLVGEVVEGGNGLYRHGLTVDRYACKQLAPTYDALAADGWKPEQAWVGIREMCEEALGDGGE